MPPKEKFDKVIFIKNLLFELIISRREFISESLNPFLPSEIFENFKS